MSVPINLDWGQFKGFINQFSLLIDYSPTGTDYFLFSSNGSVMLSAFITDPTDVLDFETNYKANAFEVANPSINDNPVIQGTIPWVCSFSGTLPGMATEAKQDVGNTSLSSIDGKIPAVGQALAIASTPVVIASNQSAIPAAQSGVWSVAQLGSWTVGAVQASAWSVVQSGAWNVTQNGAWTVGISGTVPISAAALPLPAGAATETTIAAINTKTPAMGQAAMAASTPVVIASNQSAIPATQSGAWTIGATQSGVWTVAISGTVPISAAALPLPTGAATEATLSSVNTKIPTLGQAVMAASQPVVIASDQTLSIGLGISAGKTTIGKTATLVTNSNNNDQVILTYMVTAGKTFYLEGFDWKTAKTSVDTSAATYGTISLETPSGTKIQTWIARDAGTDSFARSFAEPLPIAAGTVIRFVVTPTNNTSYTWVANLIGYEK